MSSSDGRAVRACCLTIVALVLAARGAGAQTARDSLCHAAFEAARATLGLRATMRDARGACTFSATVIQLQLLAARRATFNQEEIQRRTNEALSTTRDETSATPGDATSPIEPVESAGGSFGALSSGSGSSAITALAINPAFFFVSPKNPASMARWSRFADLTLLVPSSNSDADNDGDIDYVGVRWRFNVRGLSAGSALIRDVQAAFQGILRQSTAEVVAIDSLLTSVSASAFDSCFDSLMRAGRTGRTVEELEAGVAAVRSACGGSPLGAYGISPYRQLDENIRRARVAADSRYFGFDVRADFGALDRFGVDTIPGRSLTAAFGFGRRFPTLSGETSSGIRASLGLRFIDPNGTPASGFAAAGGISYETVRYYDHQRLSATAGLEFQAGAGETATPAGRNYLAFRGSLNVPIAGMTSATVSFATPVAGGGDMRPTLSVKANWRLLLPRV
jgi:hypothetical protein